MGCASSIGWRHWPPVRTWTTYSVSTVGCRRFIRADDIHCRGGSETLPYRYLTVILRQLSQRRPLLTVVSKDCQRDVVAFDTIQQLVGAGASRCPIFVHPIRFA